MFAAAGYVLVPIDIDGLRAAMAARYALERELGHGATATVYLAQDRKVPKKVAVKVLNPDIALAVTTERFRREIANTAPLTHPHILGLTDSGVAYDTQTGGEILYYVMPYVEGDSLAERLSRGGPLPVKEAVRIAGEVADALAYAHARGVIHRDIKPGNILLSEGHAWVADFGIARKLEEEGLTATGRDLGTPPYMSPEQTAAAGVDHRSDIYALGCVLYEMLAGRPPFVGPTSESIALQRLSGAAPSVRRSRPGVPVRLERVVARALAQKAEDRFATAAEFRDALGRRAWIPTPAVAVTAAAVVVVGLGWVAFERANAGRLTAADSLTYAVLPVAYADSAGAERLGSVLHDELAKWTGIRVVSQQRVKEEAPSGFLTTTGALKAAQRLKAGRYVTVAASPLGDSLRVHVVLYDGVARGAALGERTVRMPAGFGGVDSVTTLLIDRLLFADSTGAGGTKSFQARHDLERGLAAIREWDLEAADTAFANATRSDGAYPQAHLWLAQVRFWGAEPVPLWRSSAERAAANRERLTAIQQAFSDAVLASARGEPRVACDQFRGLTLSAPTDFAAWYGLATCLTRDNAVIRDRATSRWRFRTSFHQALRAYVRALALQPSVHGALRRGAFEFVRERLMTGGNDVRFGRALSPDTATFAANPGWEGDSLVLHPHPAADVWAGRPWTIPPSHRVALRRQRELFYDVATAWAAASPGSGAAKEALAVALEMLDDPTCVDTLRRARALAEGEGDRFRLAVAQVWAQLKFAVPLDVAGIRTAKALADSLLTVKTTPTEGEAIGLASLAALTGRAQFAVHLSYREGERRAPGVIARDGPALLVYAALGGPTDSIDALAERVEAAIGRLTDPAQQHAARMQWLARAASLAFPHHQMSSIRRLAGGGDVLVDAQAAFVRGDSARARRILGDYRVSRERIAPEHLVLDALFPEAALLSDLERPENAIQWLSPTLDRLSATAPQGFTDPARAATLVWSMALRAQLAHRVGDRASAARWARVVVQLWGDADAFLETTVERMATLTR